MKTSSAQAPSISQTLSTAFLVVPFGKLTLLDLITLHSFERTPWWFGCPFFEPCWNSWSDFLPSSFFQAERNTFFSNFLKPILEVRIMLEIPLHTFESNAWVFFSLQLQHSKWRCNLAPRLVANFHFAFALYLAIYISCGSFRNSGWYTSQGLYDSIVKTLFWLAISFFSQMAHFSDSCNLANQVLETRQSCQKDLSNYSLVLLFLFAFSTSSPNLTGRL